MLFLEELLVLLEQIMAESTGHLLISGDFNLHVDDPCSTYANRFNEILESCNLKQHVTGATHAKGHTLDLVISKKDNPLITEIKIFNPCNLGSLCGSLQPANTKTALHEEKAVL